MAIGQSVQVAQVMHHGFKTARPNLAFCLQVDQRSRRKIMGNQAPRRSSVHHLAQGIEYVMQVI